MSLRRKTILIILTTIVLFLLVLSFITRFIVMKEFENLQNQTVEEKIKAVSEIINKRFEDLAIAVKDWSAWDDTYYFVNDLNQNYIDANLEETTLANLEINFMLFINNEGTIVHEIFYDSELKKKVDTPPELKEYFKTGSDLLYYSGNEKGNYGIIMLPENPMIVCSQQILKNDSGGTPNGSLVWGYYLNKNVLEEISKTLSIDANFLRVDGELDLKAKEILGRISDGSNSVIEIADNKEVDGYFLINDYFNKPSLIFEVKMIPNIYNQGISSFYYILISILLFGIILGLILILSLDRAVLFRLQNLSDDTRRIGKAIDNSQKVMVGGNDEISKLAIEINTMLDLKRRQESILEHYASHDILTGVPNRRMLESELKRAIAKASRGIKSFLIFLDIDNFKVINDNHGHALGDKVLIALSQLVKENFRKEDIVARFGGDEFLILIEHENLEKAKIASERLRNKINQFYINLKNQKIGFTVSMGLAQIDKDDSPDIILTKADKAMYSAKEMGKNQLAIFEPGKNIQGEKFEILSKLKEAIEQDAFKLYIQPIIEIENGGVVYYEALLRLPDKKYGMILPNILMPLAENNGLIESVTDWVINKVFKILTEDKSKCIFINLSVRILEDKQYLEKLKEMIINSKISPAQLGFEISESSMLGNLVLTTEWINTIKDLGCRFAVDGFGTGFSSYGILSELPVDFFKIDGDITKGMKSDFSKTAIVKSIKLLADLLGKKTVAEWIDNNEMAKAIEEVGIKYGQGFYYGTPKSTD
jgi:diguanylate cyclase (GGDEF)-like protein